MSEQKCISGFPDETKAWETVLILFMSHMLSALTSFIQAILIAACWRSCLLSHNPFILSFSTSVHPCGPWHFWLPVTLSQGPLALQSTLPPPFPARFLAICVWPPRLSLHLTGLQLILRGMSEALIDKRVAPALITLCSGPELWVNRSYETLKNQISCLLSAFSWLDIFFYFLGGLDICCLFVSVLVFILTLEWSCDINHLAYHIVHQVIGISWLCSIHASFIILLGSWMVSFGCAVTDFLLSAQWGYQQYLPSELLWKPYAKRGTSLPYYKHTQPTYICPF